MTQIAVLTPDPSDPSYSDQWPGVLERLSQALALEGPAFWQTQEIATSPVLIEKSCDVLEGWLDAY